MSLDPQIIAAIITASVGAAPTVFDRFKAWVSRDESQKEKEKSDKVVDKIYDELRPHVTGNCVRVLTLLEKGQNPTPIELREKLYPNLQIIDGNLERGFDSEFEYRLKYMCLLGLLLDIGGGREYAITNLGHSFLIKARIEGHYPEILSPSSS